MPRNPTKDVFSSTFQIQECQFIADASRDLVVDVYGKDGRIYARKTYPITTTAKTFNELVTDPAERSIHSWWQVISVAGTIYVRPGSDTAVTSANGYSLAANDLIGGAPATGPRFASTAPPMGSVSGTVAVSSVIPGTGATNLGKAEDAPHTSGDVGVEVLGVRNDTLATMTNTDADYSPVATDKRGRAMAGACPRELKGIQKTTITSSTAETTILTAVASTFLDVYSIQIANTSGTACNVTIKDATAGTTRFIYAIPAGDTRGFAVDADSASIQAAVNNNWTATCSASVASIEITVLYVKNI